MTCVDRSSDFHQFVESARAKQPQRASSSARQRSVVHTKFHTVAGDVTRELAHTYDALERLTKCEFVGWDCVRGESAPVPTATALDASERPCAQRLHAHRATAVRSPLLLGNEIAIVAKSTSMYGDPAEDIHNLTEDIKQSMAHMRDQVCWRDIGAQLVLPLCTTNTLRFSWLCCKTFRCF